MNTTLQKNCRKQKIDLRQMMGFSTPHNIAKMSRDENVSMKIPGRICRYFKCDISEILEYRTEEVSK
ncbi:MAG: helix-turn-helix transcriptional regulator [Negativicoccus succinicivorans]|nr:helix-turn-helix transcriptional regulator [Negativicoccus succinicivorans]